ncbi:MAG: hypothetical protein HKO66_16160 [Saprospiraceae bacterium]|nr:hypothetical protein [Saprospiraceae bacterium]
MRNSIYLLVFSMMFLGCYEDIDNSTSETVTEVPDTQIETGITGQILNINEANFANHTLEVNNQSYSLNNTSFYFHLDLAYKNGQLVFLKENNKIKGIANPLLIENDVNYLEISPFPNPELSNVHNNDLNQVSIAPSIAITLDQDALLDADRTIISGSVELEHSYFNEDEVLNQIGKFAKHQDGSALVINPSLGFYIGALNNQDITLNSNLTSLNLNGTDFIDKALFVLNRFGDLELIQDNLSNNNNISISSLGLYIVADYKPGVYMEGEILKTGHRVSYMPILNENNLIYSTSNGKWATYGEEENVVQLNILSPCKDQLEVSELSTGKVDAVNYTIELSDDLDLVQNIKTTVVDCNGDAEVTQSINIKDGNNSFIYVFNEAEINTWIPVCNNEFNIAGVNSSLDESGPSFLWSFDFEDDLTIVTSCEEYDNGFSYFVINGENQIYNAFDVVSDDESTSLKAMQNEVRIHFDGLVERQYNENEVRLFIEDPNFGNNGYAISCENSAFGCGISNFNVTHFEDNANGWFRAKFSGVIWAQTISPPVAGNYPIEGVILSRIR